MLDDSAYFFDTSQGVSAKLPRPAIDASDELLGYNCTLTAAADGAQWVVYLIRTKTPSRGLTPESEQIRIHSFDLTGRKPPVVKPFPLDSDESWSLYPGSGTFVVYRTDSNSNLDEVAFFNPETLDISAQSAVPAPNEDWIVGFNYYGYALARDTSNSTRDMHFISGSTGQEVGLFPDWGDMVSTESGFLVEHTSEDGARFFDMRTNALSDVVAPYLVADELMHQGDKLAWRGTPAAAADQIYGDFFLYQGNLDDPGYFLSVLNLKTGKSVFTLDSTQLDGLKIANAHIAGQYLYLEKEEGDNPVIDFLTRDVAASTWSLRPAAELANGWSLILTGDAKTSNSIGTGVSDDAYLARGKNGQPYSGPWF
ncbi:hypothetical protein FK535_06915 [Mycolicibacterium sp. 018/SC-01/001]|uniref:hypothetical protein n=1 Tax=Mycolicibacterium sp. 018/SC-01/001 TaxID=2592069 RepID=UPI0011815A84|nr:hypothetical protein [Mycolicibacterium sp. 018/SC-01/001]TRW86199.1 hypothetical protein FK535_06915 [Mycolicibacterium sp. 018/SC-01/001]